MSKPNENMESLKTWQEKAKWKKENRLWLNKSASFAIQVFEKLREKKLTQKDLCDLLSVNKQVMSKWLSGNENLTLKTISQIENALNFIAKFEKNDEKFDDSSHEIMAQESDPSIFKVELDYKPTVLTCKIYNPYKKSPHQIAYDVVCSIEVANNEWGNVSKVGEMI